MQRESIRVAMPGFSETVQARQGDTVLATVQRAAGSRGARLPRNAMFFLNGQRVHGDAPVAETGQHAITVASRARNG